MQLILLAAGSGSRFGGSPKQFRVLPDSGGTPLYELSLRRLVALCSSAILVFPQDRLLYPEDPDRLAARLTGESGIPMTIISGGANRSESFRIAWKIRDRNSRVIAVHDANRPYLTDEYLDRIRLASALVESDGIARIPVLPSYDSLVIAKDESVLSYADRETVYRVQTPQLLPADFEPTESRDFTDEGSAILAAGLPLRIFPGDPENIKITIPSDIK